MKDKRPVNLNLFTIKFPMMAVVSILHRITGVVLFLAIPFFLWMLDQSLASEENFDALKNCLAHPLMKLFLWIILGCLSYHILAGIRHMVMDMGFGETLEGGRMGAKIVLVLAGLLLIIIGVWLW